MSLSLPKKVLYSANQRLDLVDKLAESALLDDYLSQQRKALISDSPDGRVFTGFRTPTVAGPNSGFTLSAVQGAALARDGSLLLMDGSSALTVSLQQNSINYIHAYYVETPSDPDTRRFFQSGAETAQNTNTRVTVGANLYRNTTAYGAGAPAWSGFQATAVIGGKTVVLLPLYAVAVNNANAIVSVTDCRPMFAINAGAGGTNQYEALSSNSDTGYTFSPTDAATLGMTTTRESLRALADRIQQIKGSTTWYGDAQNQMSYGSGNILWGTYNFTTGVYASNTNNPVVMGLPNNRDFGCSGNVYRRTGKSTLWVGGGSYPAANLSFSVNDDGYNGTSTRGTTSFQLQDLWLNPATTNQNIVFYSGNVFTIRAQCQLRNGAQITGLSEQSSCEYMTDLHNFSYYGFSNLQVGGLYVLGDQYVQVDPGGANTSIVMSTVNAPAALFANTLRLSFTLLSNSASAGSGQYQVVLFSQALGNPAQTAILTSGTITSATTSPGPSMSGQATTTPEVKDFSLGGITMDPLNYRYMIKITNTNGSAGPSLRLYKVALLGTGVQFGGIV